MFWGSGFTLVFPAGRVLKLVRNSVPVTISTNSLVLVKNITLSVLGCCTPPPVRLASHYVGSIRASFTVPNLVTIGSSIHIVTELYALC